MKKIVGFCILTFVLAVATPAVPLYMSDYYEENVCMLVAIILLSLTSLAGGLAKQAFKKNYLENSKEDE